MINLTTKQKEIFKEILESPDDLFLVKGGFGSGKTTLAMYLALFFLRQARKVLISRLDVREIENTLLPVLFSLALPEERKYMMQNWNKNNQHIKHPNGGELYYLSLEERMGHYRKVRSYQFSLAIIDEASEISENAFHEVYLRIRDFPPLKFVLFTNPVPQTHWLYKIFQTRKVFTLSTYDNPYLPKQYLERLEQYPPEIREIILQGEWGDINLSGVRFRLGKYYEPMEWERLDNDTIYLLESKKVLISADWGYRRTAFVMGVVDWWGRLHIIDEFEYSEKSIDEIFKDLEKTISARYRLTLKDLSWWGDVAGKQRNYWGESLHTYLNQKYQIVVRGEKILLEESIKLQDMLLNEKLEIQNEEDLKMYERPLILIYKRCERVKKGIERGYKIYDDRVEKDEDLEHIADATRYLMFYYHKYFRVGKTKIYHFARKREGRLNYI